MFIVPCKRLEYRAEGVIYVPTLPFASVARIKYFDSLQNVVFYSGSCDRCHKFLPFFLSLAGNYYCLWFLVNNCYRKERVSGMSQGCFFIHKEVGSE